MSGIRSSYIPLQYIHRNYIYKILLFERDNSALYAINSVLFSELSTTVPHAINLVATEEKLYFLEPRLNSLKAYDRLDINDEYAVSVINPSSEVSVFFWMPGSDDAYAAAYEITSNVGIELASFIDFITNQ